MVALNSSRNHKYTHILTDVPSNVFMQTLPGSTLLLERSREYSQNGNGIGRDCGGVRRLLSFVSRATGALNLG